MNISQFKFLISRNIKIDLRSNMTRLLTSKINLFLIVFVIFFSTIHGQEKGNFIKLENRFSGSSLVLEDAFGYMWISHEDGLYKYDGKNYSFVSYETVFGPHFTSDREFKFVKDAKQHFWISSFNGELTQIHKNGKYISFRDKLSYDQSPVRISSIIPDKEYVWFGSNNGSIYAYSHIDQKIDSIT